MGDKGRVYGIDHVKDLVDQSIENIRKTDAELLEKKKIVLLVGDGRKGLPEYAPYDCIHIGAGTLFLVYSLQRNT